MLQKIAMLDSGVMKALGLAVVSLLGLILSFFGVDEALFSEKAARVVDALLLVIATGASLYAGYSRATKPTPPLTQTAVDATREAVQAGKLYATALPPGAKGSTQGGFFRALFAAFLVGLLTIGTFVTLGGCTGTRAAYQSASTRDDTRVTDYAYVVAEHYAALVKEAADLAESGRVPAPALEAMQAADLAVKPLVLGDPDAPTGPRPGLRQLSARFQDVRTAETEAELQRAVDDAVLALSNFIKAVNAARGSP